MNYTQVTIESSQDRAEDLKVLLETYGVLTFEEVTHQVLEELERPELAWDYVDEDVIDLEPGAYRLTFYLAEEEDQAFLPELEEDLKNRGLGKMATSQVREEDWANEWKKYYGPVRVNEALTLVPSWIDYEAREGEEVLLMDPGMAFGSGTHETTLMCMQEVYEATKEGDTVYDIGCGSGVLSLVALKKGAGRAVGVDIDPVAVSASKANRDLNGISPQDFEVHEGDLLDVVTGQADLVVSNIIAEIIVTMLDDLTAHLVPGGTFIASGIIQDKKDLVIQGLEARGFTITRTRDLGEWVALVARGPSK